MGSCINEYILPLRELVAFLIKILSLQVPYETLSDINKSKLISYIPILLDDQGNDYNNNTLELWTLTSTSNFV